MLSTLVVQKVIWFWKKHMEDKQQFFPTKNRAKKIHSSWWRISTSIDFFDSIRSLRRECIGGSRGLQGCTSSDPISFTFMRFLAKPINMLALQPWSWRTPLINPGSTTGMQSQSQLSQHRAANIAVRFLKGKVGKNELSRRLGRLTAAKGQKTTCTFPWCSTYLFCSWTRQATDLARQTEKKTACRFPVVPDLSVCRVKKTMKSRRQKV